MLTSAGVIPTPVTSRAYQELIISMFFLSDPLEKTVPSGIRFLPHNFRSQQKEKYLFPGAFRPRIRINSEWSDETPPSWTSHCSRDGGWWEGPVPAHGSTAKPYGPEHSTSRGRGFFFLKLLLTPISKSSFWKMWERHQSIKKEKNL